jgi:hypothetical protein
MHLYSSANIRVNEMACDIRSLLQKYLIDFIEKLVFPALTVDLRQSSTATMRIGRCPSREGA